MMDSLNEKIYALELKAVEGNPNLAQVGLVLSIVFLRALFTLLAWCERSAVLRLMMSRAIATIVAYAVILLCLRWLYPAGDWATMFWSFLFAGSSLLWAGVRLIEDSESDGGKLFGLLHFVVGFAGLVLSIVILVFLVGCPIFQAFITS